MMMGSPGLSSRRMVMRSSPLMPGISMSVTTTSGWNSATAERASEGSTMACTVHPPRRSKTVRV